MVIQFSIGARDISLPHRIHISYGVHSVSHPMGIGGSFPKLKWLGHEAYGWPQSTAEVKNLWIHTLTSSYIFMVWCLMKYRHNFTLPFSPF
jgi:hypothetical protein